VATVTTDAEVKLAVTSAPLPFGTKASAAGKGGKDTRNLFMAGRTGLSFLVDGELRESHYDDCVGL